MNERISKHTHLLGKLPKVIASHDRCQSPNRHMHVAKARCTLPPGARASKPRAMLGYGTARCGTMRNARNDAWMHGCTGARSGGSCKHQGACVYSRRIPARYGPRRGSRFRRSRRRPTDSSARGGWRPGQGLQESLPGALPPTQALFTQNLAARTCLRLLSLMGGVLKKRRGAGRRAAGQPRRGPREEEGRE